MCSAIHAPLERIHPELRSHLPLHTPIATRFALFFSQLMITVDQPSDIPPLTDAEIQDLRARQRRSTRVIVVLIAVVLILGLALPLLIGFAAHWLLTYYDIATPLLRIWLSVGASVAALVLIHIVIMIPLTMFMATQSTRLQSAFEGESVDEQEAQKLIQTLANAGHATADPPQHATEDHAPPNTPPA